VDWTDTNAAIAYPISIPYHKGVSRSLSSSTTISKDATAGEIYNWLVGLYRQFEGRYAGSEVSPLLALKVKHLFFVPGTRKVFADSKIKSVSATPTSSDTHPESFFNDKKSDIRYYFS
jgi:hypothetical protein